MDPLSPPGIPSSQNRTVQQRSSRDDSTPEVPHWSFPDTTGWDPTDTENYYLGPSGDPKLVASSRPGPWRRQLVVIHDKSKEKIIFVAGQNSALQDALENKNMWRDLLIIFIQSQALVSVGFFRIGPLDQMASISITLLVTVKPGLMTFAQARDLIIDIKKLCISNFVADIEVEIMECELDQLCTSYETAMWRDLPSEAPRMGASIGPRCDSGGAGTLGGYISIDGPFRGRFAATNHHVVFPPSRPCPTEHGSQFNHNNTDFAVLQPAAEDMSATIRYHNRELAGIEEKIERFREKRDRALSGTDTFSSRLQTMLEALETSFQTVQGDVKTLEGFESAFGVVSFSSGERNIEHRTIRPFRMDWALISLNGERFLDLEEGTANEPRLFLSNRHEARLNHDLPDEIGPEYSVPRKLSHIRTIEEIATDIRKSDERLLVIKCGRTTGTTLGVVNQFVSCVRHRNDLISWELAVVNAIPTNSFCQGGDSGALVFDRFGEVVGLLHAKEGEVSYITPIEAVFEDIKASTGASRVELGFFH